MKASLYFIAGTLVGFALGTWLINWRAEREMVSHIAGERNFASVVMVNALTHLRKGHTNDAYRLLETVVDRNIAYVGENLPDAVSTSNTFNVLRRYRYGYPEYSESLRAETNAILKARNDRANELLRIKP